MRKPFEGDFRVSQTFGNKLILNGKDLYAQWGYLGHNGIDYATPSGTMILAPHEGFVKEVALDPDGYGWYIKIENEKEGSVLAHNERVFALIGEYVEEGQTVAISDNTGASTGPHLHWGYYNVPRDRANGYGGFIDQSQLLVIDNMTQDEQNILNFLKEKKANEGLVREAFGALADIPNMRKELDDLKISQENLAKELENLRTLIKQKEDEILSGEERSRVLEEENQKLVADIDYYKPYKSRYEDALNKIPNSLSGIDLIIAGIKKLFPKK